MEKLNLPTGAAQNSLKNVGESNYIPPGSINQKCGSRLLSIDRGQKHNCHVCKKELGCVHADGHWPLAAGLSRPANHADQACFRKWVKATQSGD